jgi:competence protein ComEA
VVKLKWIFILVSILCGQISNAASVNIITASAPEIADALYGVGQNKADAIVQYRSLNGPFKTEAEIKRVKGIGQAITIGNGDDIKIN